MTSDYPSDHENAKSNIACNLVLQVLQDFGELHPRHSQQVGDNISEMKVKGLQQEVRQLPP